MTDRLGALKDWARALKRDVLALWLAARDGRTPTLAKVIAGLVAAYALSPLDLIPDFLPVIGYLDDLLIVPLGIILAVKLIPPALMAEFRATAACRLIRPVSFAGMAVILTIWILAALCIAALLWSKVYTTP